MFSSVDLQCSKSSGTSSPLTFAKLPVAENSSSTSVASSSAFKKKLSFLSPFPPLIGSPNGFKQSMPNGQSSLFFRQTSSSQLRLETRLQDFQRGRLSVTASRLHYATSPTTSGSKPIPGNHFPATENFKHPKIELSTSPNNGNNSNTKPASKSSNPTQQTNSSQTSISSTSLSSGKPRRLRSTFSCPTLSSSPKIINRIPQEPLELQSSAKSFSRSLSRESTKESTTLALRSISRSTKKPTKPPISRFLSTPSQQPQSELRKARRPSSSLSLQGKLCRPSVSSESKCLNDHREPSLKRETFAGTSINPQVNHTQTTPQPSPKLGEFSAKHDQREISLNISTLKATLDAFQFDSSRSQDTRRTTNENHSPQGTTISIEEPALRYTGANRGKSIRVESPHHETLSHESNRILKYFFSRIELIVEKQLNAGVDLITKKLDSVIEEFYIKEKAREIELSRELVKRKDEFLDVIVNNMAPKQGKPNSEFLPPFKNTTTVGIQTIKDNVNSCIERIDGDKGESNKLYGGLNGVECTPQNSIDGIKYINNNRDTLTTLSKLSDKMDNIVEILNLLKVPEAQLHQATTRTSTPPRYSSNRAQPLSRNMMLNQKRSGNRGPLTPKQWSTPCSWALSDSMTLSESRMTLGMSTISVKNSGYAYGGRELDQLRSSNNTCQLLRSSSLTNIDSEKQESNNTSFEQINNRPADDIVNATRSHNVIQYKPAELFNENRYQTLLFYDNNIGTTRSQQNFSDNNGSQDVTTIATQVKQLTPTVEFCSPQSATSLRLSRDRGSIQTSLEDSILDLTSLDHCSDESNVYKNLGGCEENKKPAMEISEFNCSELGMSRLRTIPEVDSSQDSDTSALPTRYEHYQRKWGIDGISPNDAVNFTNSVVSGRDSSTFESSCTDEVKDHYKKILDEHKMYNSNNFNDNSIFDLAESIRSKNDGERSAVSSSLTDSSSASNIPQPITTKVARSLSQCTEFADNSP